MGDPPGDCVIYPQGRPDGIITSDCVKLRVNAELAYAKFVAFAVDSPEFRRRLSEITAGVAQQKISLSRFRTFFVPIAPLSEQTEIIRRVETLFAFADSMEARPAGARAATERLTPALPAKAFCGELVQQGPQR